jgi:hypothetical protein
VSFEAVHARSKMGHAFFDTSPTWAVLVACSVLVTLSGVWRRSSVGRDDEGSRGHNLRGSKPSLKKELRPLVSFVGYPT